MVARPPSHPALHSLFCWLQRSVRFIELVSCVSGINFAFSFRGVGLKVFHDCFEDLAASPSSCVKFWIFGAMVRVKQPPSLRVFRRPTRLSLSSLDIELRRAQEDLSELEVELKAARAKVCVWCEKKWACYLRPFSS